jgi:hypothetical protein
LQAVSGDFPLSKNVDETRKRDGKPQKKGDVPSKKGDVSSKKGDVLSKKGDVPSKKGNVLTKEGRRTFKKGRRTFKEGRRTFKEGKRIFGMSMTTHNCFMTVKRFILRRLKCATKRTVMDGILVENFINRMLQHVFQHTAGARSP